VHNKLHFLNSLGAFAVCCLDKLEQSGKLYPSSHTKIEQMFIGTPEPSQPEKDLPNNVYFCSEVCNRSTQIHQDVNNGA
jgi:hypothetical protein